MLASFLAAFFIALVLSLILVSGFRKRGPWNSFIMLFLTIFLASWAGGVWIAPFGATWGGIYWMPILVVGFIVTLFLAAVTPSGPRRGPSPGKRPPAAGPREESREVRVSSLNLFFWTLIVILAAGIIVRYAY